MKIKTRVLAGDWPIRTDIATTIDELKSDAEDGAPINAQKLDDIQADVEAGSDTIEVSVDADET